jgi:hypothetical protein
MFLFLFYFFHCFVRVNKLRKEKEEEKFEYLLRLKKSYFSYSSSSFLCCLAETTAVACGTLNHHNPCCFALIFLWTLRQQTFYNFNTLNAFGQKNDKDSQASQMQFKNKCMLNA